MKRFKRGAICAVILVALLCAMSVTTSATEMKTAIGIVNANSGLRLRAEASITAQILATAHRGDSVVIVERCGDWYKVEYNLQTGYMFGEYLTVKERENVELGDGAIDAVLVNMRSGPSTNYDIVTQLTEGSKVSVFGFNCGWYKVRTDGLVGYIRSDLLALTEKPYDNYGADKTDSGSSDSTYRFDGTNGSQLAEYAKQFVGYPYVYGGSSPSGFDCSGFMQYVFSQFGYSIHRTATAQLADGYAVDYDDMQPGDIIYFGYGSTATHVGMYIGNGQFVHAENSRTGVVITDLSASYYAARFLCAHRIAD